SALGRSDRAKPEQHTAGRHSEDSGRDGQPRPVTIERRACNDGKAGISVIVKSAVEALAFFDLRAEVASTWREAGRGAQEAAVEEGLKGARQDRPPSLQAR